MIFSRFFSKKKKKNKPKSVSPIFKTKCKTCDWDVYYRPFLFNLGGFAISEKQQQEYQNSKSRRLISCTCDNVDKHNHEYIFPDVFEKIM